MTGWLVIIYLIIAVVIFYPVYSVILEDGRIGDEEPDTGDRIGAGWLTFFACVIWPLAVGTYFVYRISKSIWDRPKKTQ